MSKLPTREVDLRYAQLSVPEFTKLVELVSRGSTKICYTANWMSGETLTRSQETCTAADVAEVEDPTGLVSFRIETEHDDGGTGTYVLEGGRLVGRTVGDAPYARAGTVERWWSKCVGSTWCPPWVAQTVGRAATAGAVSAIVAFAVFPTSLILLATSLVLLGVTAAYRLRAMVFTAVDAPRRPIVAAKARPSRAAAGIVVPALVTLTGVLVAFFVKSR